jgi:hypothetical protein
MYNARFPVGNDIAITGPMFPGSIVNSLPAFRRGREKWARFPRLGGPVLTRRNHASCTSAVDDSVWPGASRAILLAARSD